MQLYSECMYCIVEHHWSLVKDCPDEARKACLLYTSLYEAKLVYYSDTFENKVRTFCMNPGGLVSEEHYEGGLAVVNGHSYACLLYTSRCV